VIQVEWIKAEALRLKSVAEQVLGLAWQVWTQIDYWLN
jgi:hypothetical protein